ncbi:hypothetical protein [Inquilinus limosus]|uniref:Heparinase II N-terminal domain-containing protein n=1 Tax=Inquilinus limosus TaxID=171674 RepID=A0A211ZQW0_9PROT|nr:hypothetical protein [Inquilinus limosus]OWJ67668.1 hypothetical protein BWR60_08255 [Inquilinus limosus]
MVRRLLSLLLPFLALSAPALAAVPNGPHPRIWLTPQIVAAWQAAQSVPGSPVARAIAKCNDARLHPADYASGQYQGFRWVEALDACLVARATTGSALHRDTAIKYWQALLDDAHTVGDGNGPRYPNTSGPATPFGIVARDAGYSMRTNGAWGALSYDWLYNDLSPALRAKAAARFAQWIAFHQDPDTYQRAEAGSNYHAGHVLAVTLLAIGHADAMDSASPGSGTALWNYVTNTMWAQVMAGGVAARQPLPGGDWAEGWQYGPLSVLSYALAGRAMTERGVPQPWIGPWLHQVLYRYVYGLTPDDRMFVGGDTDDPKPTLDANPLPLTAVLAGPAATVDKAQARAELARLALPAPPANGDFTLLFQSLAAAETVTAQPIDRGALPPGWLAAGVGNFYARTGFGPGAVWMVSQCRGIISAHQHLDAGNVILSRGADALVIDPSPYGTLSTLTGNAPTMSQPHFAADYRPSQGSWGEENPPDVLSLALTTRFLFAGSRAASGVSATQCAYTGQFRFQGNASPIVNGTRRDLVLLPGATGASVVVRDLVRTTAAWSRTPNPLLLRFRSPGSFTAGPGGDRARAVVGGSALLVRRLYGAATTVARAVPVDDFCDEQGSCIDGRFPAGEWAVTVPGPSPSTIHLLDADAGTAAAPTASAMRTGTVILTAVLREGRQYYIASHTAISGIVTGYDAPAVESTQVVLDPPAGARVSVTATLNPTAHTCRFALAAASGTAGLPSQPLIMRVSPSCAVRE